MNLSFLSVWYVLITSSVFSIPRRRHTKLHHPVTVAMDHLHQPTALQCLESGLHHGHHHHRRRPIGYRRTHYRSRSNVQIWNSTAVPANSTDKLRLPDSAKVRDVEACVASFGPDSPLCKTRSEIRRDSRALGRKIHRDEASEEFFEGVSDESLNNFKPPGHVKRSFTTKIPVVEDFFGLFSTISCVGSQMNQNHSSCKPTSSSSSSSASIETTAKQTTGILLPGNLAKLRDLQPLFLDKETNKEDFFKGGEDPLSGEDSDEVDHELSSEDTEHPTEHTTENPAKIRTVLTTEAEESVFETNQTQEPISTVSVSTSENYRISKTTSQATNSHTSDDKHLCMAKHGKNCLCSIDTLIEDIHEIFSTTKGPKEVFDKVFHARCKKYVPAPESFELTSNAKPRVLSANYKQMPLDADKGPKELAEKSLEDFIDHLSAEEEDVRRVFVNTDVRLPCFPSRDVHLSPSEADHVTYVWSHGNKEAITEGRISENADADGTLAIEDVTVADSDNYTCQVSYTSPDTGQRTEDQYQHTLAVVALPVVTVRVTVHYRAPVVCDSALVEMMELYLPQQVERAVCQARGLCTVQLHSPVCHSERREQSREARSAEVDGHSRQSENPPSSRNVRQDGGGADSLMMSLNYELYLHRQGLKGLTGNATLCDPTCHLLLTLRLVQLFRESMADIALTPVLSGVAGLSGVFSPLPNTVRLRYVFGCLGGYRLDDGFCVACDRGQYSEDGWTECLPCPPRSYMGQPGARRCISCNSRWVLYCNESVQPTNVLMIIAVVAAAVLLVFCLVLYYNIAKKGRKLAQVMKGVRSKKPHRRAKLGRSQKRKSPSKMELQHLVTETDVDESDADMNE